MPVAMKQQALRRSTRRSCTLVEAPAIVLQKRTRKSPIALAVTKKRKMVEKENENPDDNIVKNKSKKCVVEILKLQEAKGDYSIKDIVKPSKLSKEEKTLVLPKKASNKIKQNTKIKTKQKKNNSKKFQLKIKGRVVSYSYTFSTSLFLICLIQ